LEGVVYSGKAKPFRLAFRLSLLVLLGVSSLLGNVSLMNGPDLLSNGKEVNAIIIGGDDEDAGDGV